MQSTLIRELSEEHRVIERLLASLLRVTARAAAGDGVTKALVASHVELFRTLLDTLHHGREEQILFAALSAVGFSRQMGPVGVMLHEHELGRDAVSQLSQIATSAEMLTGSELRALIATATSFAELLSSHIAKEDSVLYPIALHRLGAEGLTRIDTEAAGWHQPPADARDRLMRQAEDLCQATLAIGNPSRMRLAAAG